MRYQRQSPDRDPHRRHSAPAALPGKSNLTDAPRPTSAEIGKQSRAELQSPSRSPSPILQGGQQLIGDGAQLRASMATTVAAVATRSSSPGGSTTGGEGGDSELEQTLIALQQCVARMQGHLDEWEARFGASEAPSPAVAPDRTHDGNQALDSLIASMERMQALLAELGTETVPPSPQDTAAPPLPALGPAVADHPRAVDPEPAAAEPAAAEPTLLVPPRDVEAVDSAVRPTAIDLPARPAPAHLGPANATVRTPDPDPSPDHNASYDLKKRVFKALSYGGAAVGTAGSFAGWVASHWVGTKIQQTSQTGGGLAKNVVGAVGDYYDSKEKATHDPPASTSGFKQKIAGQLISALGQAISLVGVLAPGADAARPAGAAVNGIGMIFVGFGELDQGNKAKAYANFAGAACNFIGAAGGGIISSATEHKVAKIVAEALLDVGADANAWTPLGGAYDDAAKSKAPGDTRLEKLKRDPKPGGQAINGLGAWLNFAANVMNRHADAEQAAGDASSATTLKIIALALGGFASVASTYGNLATAHGEAYPVKPPARDLEAVAMNDLDPTNATP